MDPITPKDIKNVSGQHAGMGYEFARVFKTLRDRQMDDSRVLKMAIEFLDQIGEMKYK
jgi:hypothetical protein